MPEKILVLLSALYNSAIKKNVNCSCSSDFGPCLFHCIYIIEQQLKSAALDMSWPTVDLSTAYVSKVRFGVFV